MKSLKQLCKPRSSVFDPSRRDTVLDLTDLVEDHIDAQDFFEENYITDGMRHLLRESFRRFERKSTQGVYVLTQAMGGGKTHNMIALGLLAKNPKLRPKVMGSDYESAALARIRVVGFTGRESDAPLGIWGAIADQLGKKETFKDYYSPLSAPGQKAWINLLKGEPLLILLDELAPYLENARAKTIGDSNLASVTTTAMSNLLVAVNKSELENVCIVISDLTATYGEGTQQIQRALSNLENEVNRSAMRLEPVGMNTDEVYHILRTRIFEEMPADEEIAKVSQAYAQAVKDARQMDITNASPEKFASLITGSYPFHFSIRDLYARFRENPGFQQTRGLIRLMRVVVSQLYETGRADQIALIHPYDLDLNDKETLTEITAINPSLENAIAHDMASNGGAVAEIMDSNMGGDSNTQDTAKLILVSSLANVPNAVLGLSVPEVISYLCVPGRDVSRLQQDVFGRFFTSAWYLHTSRDGKLFFRNVKNLVADLKTRAESYNRESSLRELRSFLGDLFQPSLKDCYQEVLTLPPIDEIQMSQERVTLIICEPQENAGLGPDLKKFYEDLDYKNRILFLSGQSGTLDHLLERSAELKGIGSILDDMDAEKVAENDPQRSKAIELQDQIRFQLLSAARETFTTLYYPHVNQLRTADFLMAFKDNNYNGEKQIRETLKGKQKFTEDVESESFRKKCEQRLFTQKAMIWNEVKRRAAMNTEWQWHRTDALDRLKEDMVHKDQWREEGTYVEKPPFPRPQTGLRIQEMQRDDDTGEVTLKLVPVHGDTVYFEIDSPATTASEKVENMKNFLTKELKISFLCVDASGEHETGEPVGWQNRITIKSRVFQSDTRKMVELKAGPEAPIRYTSDGSDPRLSGGTYDGPFAVPPKTQVVLAVAEKKGVVSEVHRRDIRWDKDEEFTIDPERPARWLREHLPTTTKETYDFLVLLKKYDAAALGPRVTLGGKNWLELSFDQEYSINGEDLEGIIDHLRGLMAEGQVSMEVTGLSFSTGQRLLDWVAEVKTEIRPDEVKQ